MKSSNISLIIKHFNMSFWQVKKHKWQAKICLACQKIKKVAGYNFFSILSPALAPAELKRDISLLCSNVLPSEALRIVQSRKNGPSINIEKSHVAVV